MHIFISLCSHQRCFVLEVMGRHCGWVNEWWADEWMNEGANEWMDDEFCLRCFVMSLLSNKTYITTDVIVCELIAYIIHRLTGTWHLWQPWLQRLIGCSSQNAHLRLVGRTGFVTNLLRSQCFTCFLFCDLVASALVAFWKHRLVCSTFEGLLDAN